MLKNAKSLFLLFVVFTIVLCQPIKAQEVLTEAKAIQIALTKNPDLQVILKEAGLAKADLKQAGILENPIIAGDFAFYNLQNSFHPSVAIQKNITDLILRGLKVKLAKDKLDQTRSEIEFAIANLIFELRVHYYNFVAAKQNYDLYQKIVLAAEIESEFATEQKKVGNINDKDFTSHQIDLTHVKKELAEVEKDYKLAKTELIRVLGLNNEDFNYDESLSLGDLPSKEIQESELENLALTNRADMLAQKQELKALEKSVRLAKLSSIPPIHIGTEFHSEPDGTAWAPIIQTELPIFNRNQGQRQRNAVLLEQSQNKLAAKFLDIKTQVKIAYINLLTHRNIVESYSKLLVEQNLNSLEFVELQYNYMLADIYDLLHAKTSTTEAEILSVEALRNYWISRADLERTIGLGLLEERNEILKTF